MEDRNFEKDLDRPWWGWIAFANNEKCTAKILFVKPWEVLSLQSHKKREEMWYVISWKIKVYRWPVKDSLEEIKQNLKTYDLWEWENVVISPNQVHKMEWLWDETSKILEIMKWEWDEYWDEIRYEDKYGRTSPN